MATAQDRFGHMRALINNDGCGRLAVLGDTSTADVRAMIDTYVVSAFAMIHAVLPAVRAKRVGQIGSVAG